MDRLVGILRTRDPGWVAAKRALRAAVVASATFAIATAIRPGHSSLRLFAAFGAIDLLLMVDFPGRPGARLRSYLWLVAVCAVLITLGTLCSRQPALAAIGMGLVGFAVVFPGVVSSQIAAGANAALLAFVLPVAVPAPAGDVPERLAGWVLAAAFSVPALVWVFPRPWHDKLRQQLAAAMRALAVVARSHGRGQADPAAQAAATDELARLRRLFQDTAFRPGEAAGHDVALAKLVGRTRWAGRAALLDHSEEAVLDLPSVRRTDRAVAEVLEASAALVCDGGPGVQRRGAGQHLTETVEQMAAARDANQAAELRRLLARRLEGSETSSTLAEQHGQRLLGVLDPTFRARALASATELVADGALEAADMRRDETGRLVVTRRGSWRAAWAAAGEVLASHLDLGSVWFRNSLRTALGLAAAVGLIELTDVGHGFWVVLGAMSVLRSNAVGTSANAVRAIVGTFVGFVIGAVVLLALANHYDALWALLPVAIFVSGLAPTAISFTASQAAFTCVVLMLFNIIQPAGWKLGFTRIEDVAMGAGVSLVAGLVLWPRGARSALGRALCEAYRSTWYYMLAAIGQATGPDGADSATETERASRPAFQRLEDAFRQYAGERGPKPVPVESVVDLAIGARQTRVAAFSLAQLPPLTAGRGAPPLPSVASARRQLQDYCLAVCRWFDELAGVLASRSGTLPPLAAAGDPLQPALLAAFVDAANAKRPTDVRATLRMLWADETLRYGLALQQNLAAVTGELEPGRKPAQSAPAEAGHLALSPDAGGGL